MKTVSTSFISIELYILWYFWAFWKLNLFFNCLILIFSVIKQNSFFILFVQAFVTFRHSFAAQQDRRGSRHLAGDYPLATPPPRQKFKTVSCPSQWRQCRKHLATWNISTYVCSKLKNWKRSKLCTILVVIIVKMKFSKLCTILVVIIVKIIFISSFFF